MTDTIHHLVERFGLLAVFLGCMAEGESIAVLAGFFARQHLFQPWSAFAIAAAGAFVGDGLFFMLGRHFADDKRVQLLRRRPGFSHAYRMVEAHPNLFVLGNRYVYGMRTVGGLAVGLSRIPTGRFLVLNGISSLVWAALFVSLGYVFGLGAEHFFGDALKKHHRLLIGLAIALAVALVGWLIAHQVAKREARD